MLYFGTLPHTRILVGLGILEEHMQSVHAVIGIPTQTQDASTTTPRAWVMSQQYVHTLTRFGGIPWLIPALQGDHATLRAIYDQMDGLFLAGGLDIDPSAYGEARHHLCGESDLARDDVELTLARWAIEDRKPVLAICRGFQIINVAMGGTLYQDLNFQYPQAIKHDYFPTRYPRTLLSHSIETVPGTRLHRLFGVPRLKVNSMHHQGIKTLGRGLVPSAYAPDGLIEAIESADEHFLIGVQWHPEEMVETDPRMRRLFTRFVQAAAEYRARKQATTVPDDTSIRLSA